MNVMRTLNNHSQSSTGSDLQSVHIPVLLQEVLAELDLQKGDIVLDATLGGGGHSCEMARQIGKGGTLIGIDADSVAIKRTRQYLEAQLLSDMPTLHPKARLYSGPL